MSPFLSYAIALSYSLHFSTRYLMQVIWKIVSLLKSVLDFKYHQPRHIPAKWLSSASFLRWVSKMLFVEKYLQTLGEAASVTYCNFFFLKAAMFFFKKNHTKHSVIILRSRIRLEQRDN